MSDAADIEVDRDHHGLRIVPIMRREPVRIWMAAAAGIVASLLVPGVDVPYRAAAAVVFLALALYARDARATTLVLGHDTLALETMRLGWPVRHEEPWDRVVVDSVWEPPTLALELGGRRFSIPWNTSRQSLEDTVDVLRDAKSRFVPGQADIAPPPESLVRIADRERES